MFVCASRPSARPHNPMIAEFVNLQSAVGIKKAVGMSVSVCYSVSSFLMKRQQHVRVLYDAYRVPLSIYAVLYAQLRLSV